MRWKLAVVACSLALLSGACSKSAPPVEAPQLHGVPAIPPGQFGGGGGQNGGAHDRNGTDGAANDGSDSGTHASAASPSTSAKSGSVTVDDSKTFAYGTTDLATLSRDAASMTSTVDQLSTDVSSMDANAAQSDAKTLQNQALQLETASVGATDRMKPLGPQDATLQDARADCLRVYSLAASYAAAALSISAALRSADAKAMHAALGDIKDLQGTSDDLSSAYDKATKELEKWAKANPTGASAALAKYGG